MSHPEIPPPDLRSVWIVDEGSPGHFAQSSSVADALKARIPGLDVRTVRGMRRLRGMSRGLARLIMGPRGARVPDRLRARIMAGTEIPDGPSAGPDLILASGGSGVFCARCLANDRGVPLAFIGERKPYPPGWFHSVFTPSLVETAPCDVPIDLIPVPVTPAKVADAANSYARPDGPLCAMLIGGRSRSHRYTSEDWTILATAMNAFAEREGIRWLVTTSRRTGASTEATLKGAMDPAKVGDAIWWSERPRKDLHAMLGASEIVFVTQDSMTMVTESVSAGRPTVVLSPQSTVSQTGNFLFDYMTRLEAASWIVRLPIRDFAALPTRDDIQRRIAPQRESAAFRVADALLERLGTGPND